jgi:subfamily B ATP-binding cassette protein MsbA
MTSFSTVVNFVKPYKSWFYRAIVLTTACTALSLVPPYLLGIIVDKVIGLQRYDLVFSIIVLFIATPILGNFIGLANNYIVSLIGDKLVLDMRKQLYHHLQHLPMRFYDKSSTGAIMEKLMGDVGQVQQMVATQTVTFCSDIVACFVATGFMVALNWRMTLLLLIFVPIYVINYNYFIDRIRNAGETLRIKMEDMSSGMQERLSGAMAVKSFGQERAEDRKFTTDAFEAKTTGESLITFSTAFNTSTNLINWLGTNTLYMVGCYLVVKGEMPLGAVLAFLSYSAYVLGPAVRFSQMSEQVERAMVSVNRIASLLNESPEPADPPDAAHTINMEGHVEFKDICFEYEKGSPILNHLTLDVPKGKTVALVGHTGCGKTTIISLLLRFYRVCSGEILIDGINLNRYSHASLRRNIAMVPQDPVLFEGSVRENIAYGRPEALIDEVIAAAKAAEIHKTIMELPQGYDTLLGEEGMKLSVGQKQRLIIARAILANPAILIMDEATSSLDTESERLLQKALARIMENRTCFVVAHRLSTIVSADIIVVMSKGKILEMGRHQELLEIQGGHYRQLYMTQFTKVA